MILVIDNYDSFTFNLVQILLKNKMPVKVIKNDEWTIADVCRNQQLIEAFLFSPGPGHPAQATLCRQVLTEFASTHPILGVCLGHQVIAEYFGGKVVKAQRPMHGKLSEIEHESKGTFKGLPSKFKVVRYHSLIVEESTLPQCLEVTARTKCNSKLTAARVQASSTSTEENHALTPETEIMALRHKDWSIESWQFHPESILTEHGEQLLLNFFQQSNPL